MKTIDDIRSKVEAKRAAAIAMARNSGKDWRRGFGWAKDDPIYDEAMRLGAEWRAEVNRKSLVEPALHDAAS